MCAYTLNHMKMRCTFDATHGTTFLFPYKLNDPGTIWTAYDNKRK
jgi:hypothetical protein